MLILLFGSLLALVIWYEFIGKYSVAAINVDQNDDDEWFLDTIQEERDEEEDAKND